MVFRSNKKPDALADGALDTLGSVMHVLGDESFPLDQDIDADSFRCKCKQFAGHIENGAAVPEFDIPQSENGQREWALVRRFFADRRRAEKIFVTERLQNYRDVVGDLVNGLRQVGARDQDTESRINEGLSDVQNAVGVGHLPEIKEALDAAVKNVAETFAEQKREYENQLGQLKNRMSNLRQDLVAAREEMQRDSLTGTYNRGAFDTGIEKAVNVRFMLNQPVALIMIDLDRFKDINDTFGHAAGDAVLRSVGECLERTFIRKGDIVARFGGDEFGVILADTTAGDALRLTERFLERVNSIDIPVIDDDVSISCSAGVTEVYGDDSIESAIKRADGALYEAKAAGRNVARKATVASDAASA